MLRKIFKSLGRAMLYWLEALGKYPPLSRDCAPGAWHHLQRTTTPELADDLPGPDKAPGPHLFLRMSH